MSLVTQVSDLATRIGTEIKAVSGRIGTLTSLTTTDKTNVVAAINEVKTLASGGSGVTIDDTTPSTTTVYSGTKTQNIVDAKPAINDGVTAADSVWSSSKTSNSISTAVATKPSINDTAASGTSVYSSSKTDSQISTAVANLIDSSPGALDTLNELAAALGDDPNFATTINTALANRVRVDAAQSFTAPQQAQARANISAVGTADVGDTSTDFVTVFETALL